MTPGDRIKRKDTFGTFIMDARPEDKKSHVWVLLEGDQTCTLVHESSLVSVPKGSK